MEGGCTGRGCGLGVFLVFVMVYLECPQGKLTVRVYKTLPWGISVIEDEPTEDSRTTYYSNLRM